MVRATLEQLSDIRIIKNTPEGEVEFLISSESTTTTAQIIKHFHEQQKQVDEGLVAPTEIKQKIIPNPTFKYLISLKKTPGPQLNTKGYESMVVTDNQSIIRQNIKKEFASDQVFFNGDTIEIWSSEKINITKLENEKILTAANLPLFGNGIKSVRLVEQ